MSNGHDDGKKNAMHILNCYGYYSDEEYRHPAIGRDRIDVVGKRKIDTLPFIGIEVHIKGVLDNDITKLRKLQSLDFRVVLTSNKELINSMKATNTGIEWFPLPSSTEKAFEDFVRRISNAPSDKPYYFDMLKTLQLSNPDPDFVKFKEQIEKAGLDATLALSVIFNGALENIHDNENLINSKEYVFLQSLGVMDGLEIYWYDMQYGNQLKYSFEGVKYPSGSSRKMEGQPLYYESNKALIRMIIKEFISGEHSKLEASLGNYSDTLREIALMGKMGRMTKAIFPDEFTYEMSFSPTLLDFETSPTEVNRIVALASNPFLESDLWDFYMTLVDIGLAKKDSNLIKTLYKPLSEEIDCIGAVSKYENAVDDYLSWWIMVQGGINKAPMQGYCNTLNIPWDLVENCIKETVAKGITSPFIQINGDLRNKIKSVRPYGDKGGVSDIAVYNRDEFLELCSDKMKESLKKIV